MAPGLPLGPEPEQGWGAPVRQGEAGLAVRALRIARTQKYIAESGHKQEHVY